MFLKQSRQLVLEGTLRDFAINLNTGFNPTVEVLFDSGQEAAGAVLNKPVLAALRKQESAGAKEFQEGICVLL